MKLEALSLKYILQSHLSLIYQNTKNVKPKFYYLTIIWWLGKVCNKLPLSSPKYGGGQINLTISSPRENTNMIGIIFSSQLFPQASVSFRLFVWKAVLLH